MELASDLSMVLDSLTACANMSFLILCSISSSWTLVHLWRATQKNLIISHWDDLA